jgi:hypothetical protein
MDAEPNLNRSMQIRRDADKELTASTSIYVKI